MSTKQQPTKLAEIAQGHEVAKSSQKEESLEGVWKKLPDVLRKQLALQLAELLHQVVSQSIEREVHNEQPSQN